MAPSPRLVDQQTQHLDKPWASASRLLLHNAHTFPPGTTTINQNHKAFDADRLHCPHCGARTNVLDKYAGLTGPCAQCGGTITIPPLAGQPPIPVPSRRKSHIGLVILIVLLGLGIPILA